MTPSQRFTLAIEVSRAGLAFARAGGVADAASTFDPAGLFVALDEAAIGFVIVGGLAGAAHGVVRANADIDLVVEPNATLESVGIAQPVRSARTRWGDLHFHDDQSFRQLCENAFAIPLENADAVICSLADLRAMKIAQARPRDVIDLAELDELTQDRSK
jgi:hypothetical protein